MEDLNPANKLTQACTQSPTERKRIPFSTAIQKLEVPERPGYHRHWFGNEPGRIERAKLAGYEFVKAEDVAVAATSLGNSSAASGNSDLGSLVSVPAGSGTGAASSGRLILMECTEEAWQERNTALDNRNDQVAATLTAGLVGSERDAPGDTRHRRAESARGNSDLSLFTKKPQARRA